MSRELGKMLVIAGGVALVIGLFLLYKDRVPWLNRLGNLPGDFRFERENVKVYFPIATSILISVILSLLFWLFRSR